MITETERVQRPITSPAGESIWQLLLRWRWWLGAAIGLAFAAGRAIESLILREVAGNPQLLFDVLLWGGLGGAAVWFSLTWASQQERRHQTELERLLQQQHQLNQQLQRSNAQLSLLSEVNQSLAASASLDEILDVALRLPQRLIPSVAAALWLHDGGDAVLARTANVTAEQLHERRRSLLTPVSNGLEPQPLTALGDPDGLAGVCVHLPLHDGTVAVGWIELYTRGKLTLQPDEWTLLKTIAGEVGEAITGARRRSREERAIYELEQAIAEERARIARDIHDGLAQTLAFRRMRVDLWLDWLDQEPERLRAELQALKPALREQIAELRRAIFALRPIAFDELGFVGGLHRYIVEFGTQQGWATEVDLGALSAFLTPQLEATLFRLVQEALTNVAKHAQATAVTVTSAGVDDGLQMVIRDNGLGFAPGTAEGDGSQLGLRQMRERLTALHGRLTILSQPGAGAELRVWLPLRRTRNAPGALTAG
jgi:signal transduction histidine kinase